MGELNLVQDLATVTIAAGLSGLVCQKIGLSSVVGFLVAGLIVGPHLRVFPALSDPAEIRALAELGLAFLMFSIGLELSLAKIRRLGVGIFVGVLISTTVIFFLVRTILIRFRLGEIESSLFGAMMIASSSAIIGKVLHDADLIHQRAGNLALGISVIEDLVAVVVLTFISSAANTHSSVEIGHTIWVLFSFVTLTAALGLLLLPRLLRLLEQVGNDLLTITVAGLALAIGVVSVHTGYSLALGSFLLGVIIAETPQRFTVERALQGMRDIFLAIFFVSIGMLIEPRELLENWQFILGLGVLAVIVRLVSVGLALTISGTPNRDAIRTGLMVTPIGEFAFIIAQLGVVTGLLRAEFYPVAIGTAAVTAVLAPPLIRQSGPISDLLIRCQPRLLHESLGVYQDFLMRLSQSQARSHVLHLARQKLGPVLLSLIFVSGITVFAPALLPPFIGRFPMLGTGAVKNLFWVLIGVSVTVPVIAVERPFLEFLSGLAKTDSNDDRPRPVLQAALQMVALMLFLLWLGVLVILARATIWLFVGAAFAATVAGVFFGRQIARLHHGIAAEIGNAILTAEERRARHHQEWLKEHQEWDLQLAELRVPNSMHWFGSDLGQLGLRRKYGCSVVGVQRQGFPVPNLVPETMLYPGDTLLLLGEPDRIKLVRKDFARVVEDLQKVDLLDEIRLESIEVPQGSPLADHTLAELDLTRQTGIQVAGIARGSHRVLSPGPLQIIATGDWLLVVGTREQIGTFRSWI